MTFITRDRVTYGLRKCLMAVLSLQQDCKGMLQIASGVMRILYLYSN